MFDYEVDSDDEWEDESEGEDLGNSEKEEEDTPITSTAEDGENSEEEVRIPIYRRSPFSSLYYYLLT